MITKIDPPIVIEFFDGSRGLAIFLENNTDLIVEMEDGSYVKVYDLPSEALDFNNPTIN